MHLLYRLHCHLRNTFPDSWALGHCGTQRADSSESSGKGGTDHFYYFAKMSISSLFSKWRRSLIDSVWGPVLTSEDRRVCFSHRHHYSSVIIHYFTANTELQIDLHVLWTGQTMWVLSWRRDSIVVLERNAIICHQIQKNRFYWLGCSTGCGKRYMSWMKCHRH